MVMGNPLEIITIDLLPITSPRGMLSRLRLVAALFICDEKENKGVKYLG
jgi:hypothetical protein